MSRIEYGLGGFGDLRLKKGGLNFTAALWNGLEAAFVDLPAREPERFSLLACFATRL